MESNVALKSCLAVGVTAIAAALVASRVYSNKSQRKALPTTEEMDRMLGGRQGVCVFLGSSEGNNPEYIKAAETIGKKLAERGLALVYGGGNIGLMGAVARSHSKHGGTVIGVIPRALSNRELTGDPVCPDSIILTDSMHERKSIMAALSSAFIVLPGGYGTMEECFEMITWTQLSVHNKPVGLLNTCGFWDKLVELVNHASKEGFIRPKSLDIITTESDPDKLLDKILVHRPPPEFTLPWTINASQT
mmetsp:Transcript_9508/g.17531  ORF Transcript_9508/g.17531 Transcript_9508/m.17531 type:complete len:248 (-) Transcript_9508:956-1699(-)